MNHSVEESWKAFYLVFRSIRSWLFRDFLNPTILRSLKAGLAFTTTALEATTLANNGESEKPYKATALTLRHPGVKDFKGKEATQSSMHL